MVFAHTFNIQIFEGVRNIAGYQYQAAFLIKDNHQSILQPMFLQH